MTRKPHSEEAWGIKMWADTPGPYWMIDPEFCIRTFKTRTAALITNLSFLEHGHHRVVRVRVTELPPKAKGKRKGTKR